MSAIYTSNDSLIYDTVRGGKKITDTREQFTLAMHFEGVECTFGDDYQPSFSIREGHWSKDIDRDSLHYKRLINSMYFTAWHWMYDNLHIIKVYREKPESYLSPTLLIESALAYNARDMGEKFFMTVFYRALLQTDFADKAIEMPEYTRDNSF